MAPDISGLTGHVSGDAKGKQLLLLVGIDQLGDGEAVDHQLAGAHEGEAGIRKIIRQAQRLSEPQPLAEIGEQGVQAFGLIRLGVDPASFGLAGEDRVIFSDLVDPILAKAKIGEAPFQLCAFDRLLGDLLAGIC